MKTADATIERLMRHYGDLQLAGLQHSGTTRLRVSRRSIAQLVIEGDNSVERLSHRASGGRYARCKGASPPKA